MGRVCLFCTLDILEQGSSISFRRGPNSANNTKPRATDIYIYIYIYIYVYIILIITIIILLLLLLK